MSIGVTVSIFIFAGTIPVSNEQFIISAHGAAITDKLVFVIIVGSR